MIDHLYLLPPTLECPVNMSKGMRLIEPALKQS